MDLALKGDAPFSVGGASDLPVVKGEDASLGATDCAAVCGGVAASFEPAVSEPAVCWGAAYGQRTESRCKYHFPRLEKRRKLGLRLLLV